MTMTPANRELLRKVAERFRALGDETRLRLLLRLSEGECNVSSLSEELGVGQASVSKHLATLRNVGFLDVRRQGAQSFYSVREPLAEQVCREMLEGVLRHHTQIQSALGLQEAGAGRSIDRNGD